ncbi:hypothetical protein AK830_g1381 [Neonectria ditissima]|uniref:NB-ARC domain-containing protein n=1 Tax=Neonectria ditissima TaxID=78410 RepID=A0A0P7BN39_9HYPO|nr:hypothetical protein AK830_g1381 [Neonectria ditissima]
MTDRVSYGNIDGGNVFTGVTASGSATQNFNFHNSSPSTDSCHAIAYHRNEDFVGRPDINEKLEALLSPTSNEAQTAALWGLGGSGKTQIALEYAHNRSHDSSCSVFWVHADNKTTFSQDYKTIATALGLDSKLDGEDLLKEVQNGIQSKRRWLLVIDNADDLALFGVKASLDKPTSNLRDYIPKGPRGTVLWTSRDKNIAGTLVSPQRGLSVTSMTVDEAQQLLEKATNQTMNSDEIPSARRLLEELSWLPLAISQAGAYIRRTRTPIDEYLLMLTEGKERWRVLKESEFDRHRRSDAPNSVLETWNISIRRIKKENRTAYKMLHIIAYVDNQNIPVEVLVAAAVFSSRRGKKAPHRQELEARSAILRLEEFSFITPQQTVAGKETFEMHKLVQEASRYGLYAKSLPKRDVMALRWWSRLVRKGHGRDEAYFASAALEIMTQLFDYDMDDTEQWPLFERYLAHAMRVCDWVDICVREKVSDLLKDIGNYMYDRGRWDAAAMMHQRALDLRREMLGKKDWKYIKGLVNLGWALYRLDRLQESEEATSEALRLACKCLGKEHSLALASRCLVSAVYQKQGRLDEAEAMAVEALQLARDTYGESSDTATGCLQELAVVHVDQGQLEGALEAQLEVLEAFRQMHGERHSYTAGTLHYLGGTYYRQQDWAQAKECFTKALEINREILGEDHPHTLATMRNLAYVRREQGHDLEATAQMRECLRLCHQFLGPNHPHTKDADKVFEKWAEERNPEY